MKRITQPLLLALALGLSGCAAQPSDAPAPLTVAEWKALPVETKYSPETLERLKEGNPTLQTPEGWTAFSRTTLAEARKKDSPHGKR